MRAEGAQRGRALERAVRLIQEVILESDPQFTGIGFTVESNKIIKVSGVPHEIDVFVKTLPGSAYESVWIFECKDWKKPVGKNEVMILAGKAHAVGASRGFLVAREITKPARAQLAVDTRIKFVRCADDFLGPLDVIGMIHSVHDPLARTISLKFRGVPPQKHPAKLEWEGKMCVFNGRAMSFASFVEDLFMQMVHGDQARNSIKYRQVGTHPAGCTERYGFAVGEFIFDGSDVEQIEIAGQYFVTVTRETLTSRFQLEGQGQVFSFESVEDVIPGAKLQVNVVQRL